MITIKEAKSIREQCEATHIVIFAVDASGAQHVVTHGGTRAQARQAAEAGNRLKAALGWPEHLCKSKPVERMCKNCEFWEVDRGIFCVNGWTGGDRGWCHLAPGKPPRTDRDAFCGQFEPKPEAPNDR